MSFRSATLLFVTALILIAGCNKSQNDQAANTTDEPSQPTSIAATESTDSDNVKLDILSYDEILQRIADKRGKVVVMDAWSTSCPPCMKDFHNLVELNKEHGGEDLACISLSFDYEGLGEPAEAAEPVLTFLRSQGATFDNLMSNEESDVLYRKFELNSVPAIFVYDRSGKLRERFEKEGAYEQVRELVAQLLKEESPVDTNPATASPGDGVQ